MTQYTNTQVEGKKYIFEESTSVRHKHFTGRKQKDYSILKENHHNSLCVACAHAALKGPHQSINVGWKTLISKGRVKYCRRVGSTHRAFPHSQPPWMRISLSRHDLLGEERWPISQRRRG